VVGSAPHADQGVSASRHSASGRSAPVVYGKRWEPFGEYACVSTDNGTTWDIGREIMLAAAPNGDLGYPASVETRDGTIWTVYYQVDRAGEKPCLMGTHWRMKAR